MNRSLDHLINQYTADLNTAQSPVITHLTISKITNDLVAIKTQLNSIKTHKSYESLLNKYRELTYLLDRKKYQNDKKLEELKREASPDIVSDGSTDNEEVSAVKVAGSGVYNTGSNPRKNDINELRKRLLDNTTSELTNDYHESVQQDIIQDLSNLAVDLKNSAISLSKKILDDNELLSRTQDNLLKNDNLMNVVGGNLNNYVLNKSGGKISFWFLLKVSIGLILAFILMMLIINILPKQ